MFIHWFCFDYRFHGDFSKQMKRTTDERHDQNKCIRTNNINTKVD